MSLKIEGLAGAALEVIGQDAATGAVELVAEPDGVERYRLLVTAPASSTTVTGETAIRFVVEGADGESATAAAPFSGPEHAEMTSGTLRGIARFLGRRSFLRGHDRGRRAFFVVRAVATFPGEMRPELLRPGAGLQPHAGTTAETGPARMEGRGRHRRRLDADRAPSQRRRPAARWTARLRAGASLGQSADGELVDLQWRVARRVRDAISTQKGTSGSKRRNHRHAGEQATPSSRPSRRWWRHDRIGIASVARAVLRRRDHRSLAQDPAAFVTELHGGNGARYRRPRRALRRMPVEDRRRHRQALPGVEPRGSTSRPAGCMSSGRAAYRRAASSRRSRRSAMARPPSIRAKPDEANAQAERRLLDRDGRGGLGRPQPSCCCRKRSGSAAIMPPETRTLLHWVSAVIAVPACGLRRA